MLLSLTWHLNSLDDCLSLLLLASAWSLKSDSDWLCDNISTLIGSTSSGKLDRPCRLLGYYTESKFDGIMQCVNP